MRPLEGVTVVALEQAVAAPFATRQLADLGARVIKVERPGGGDFARQYDHTVRGMSSHFVWLNRSKESIVLDLAEERGRDVMRALVASADVFVQNLAPGAAHRLGLGAKELRARHRSLIHVSISGYGEGGPYENKKAYDLLVQCEAGLLSITGSEDEPAKAGIPVADIAAGMYAYSGALSALISRLRTGDGATLEVSMLEALAEWMGFPMYFTTYGGQAPPRTGASHAAIAPYGPFACRSGELVFVAVQNEREWPAFCTTVLERADLLVEERFSSNAARVANRPHLDSIVSEVFARLEMDTVISRLDTAGIASARMRGVADLANHEQLMARGRWRDVDSPVGRLRALLPPATLAGHEPLMGPVPKAGEHTDQILQELGFQAEQL